MNIRIFKIGDKLLIASMVLITAFFMVWNAVNIRNDANLQAIITRNGEIVKQINLSDQNDPEYIHLNGKYDQVILVEKGRIRFWDSDCPYQTCVKTGWLNKAGDKAVCIPSQTIIRIEGENQQIDMLAY